MNAMNPQRVGRWVKSATVSARPPTCALSRGAFWCGIFSRSSRSPSSCMISSVEGWIVSPRKSRRKSACFSRTRTSTPARANSSPSIIPAGPPPATQHRTEILVATMDPLSLSQDRTSSHLPAFFQLRQPLPDRVCAVIVGRRRRLEIPLVLHNRFIYATGPFESQTQTGVRVDGIGSKSERLTVLGDRLVELSLARERLPQRHVNAGIFPAELERFAKGIDCQGHAIDRQKDMTKMKICTGRQVVFVVRIEVDRLHQLGHREFVLRRLRIGQAELQPCARVGRGPADRFHPF